MYAFIDESTRNEDFYFLGAVVVDDAQYQRLEDDLDMLLIHYENHHPPIERHHELHGSAIMRAADAPWRYVPKRLCIQLFREALEILESSGARIYIEGINIGKLHERGYSWTHPPREVAFNYLFERINECCTTVEPMVKVFADEHHTSEVSVSNFRNYKEFGTFGYKSSKLNNIHPNFVFLPSHDSRALQAADLVTYLFNRLRTIVEADERAHKAKLDLWNIIKPAISGQRGRGRIWP